MVLPNARGSKCSGEGERAPSSDLDAYTLLTTLYAQTQKTDAFTSNTLYKFMFDTGWRKLFPQGLASWQDSNQFWATAQQRVIPTIVCLNLSRIFSAASFHA